MVHYQPGLSTLPYPPQTCPKCGSHRTQIVGISNEGRTLVLRCNACGARSEVAPPVEEASGQTSASNEPGRAVEWQYT